jgi:hypothetical protein
MYSDDEIRQIILDFLNEESPNYPNANRLIYRTTDKRFLTVALAIIQQDDEKLVEAGLNVITHLNKFCSSDYMPQILPFLENPSHCATAISIIRRIADVSVVPRLLQFLAYPDAKVRLQAFRAVVELAYPDALDITLYMLNDTDSEIRASACRVLAYLGNPIAVESLIEILSDNEIGQSLPINAIAAETLGKLGDKRAVEPLKIAVNYGNQALSFHAIEALWEMEGEKLQDFYLVQINHRHEETRKKVVQILGQIGKTEFVDTLISVSQNDSCYGVQLTATAALFKLSTKESLEAASYWEKHYRRNDES